MLYYTVTAKNSDGFVSAVKTGSASPMTVDGLFPDTYTFTVTATNIIGESSPSTPSSPIFVPGGE